MFFCPRRYRKEFCSGKMSRSGIFASVYESVCIRRAGFFVQQGNPLPDFLEKKSGMQVIPIFGFSRILCGSIRGRREPTAERFRDSRPCASVFDGAARVPPAEKFGRSVGFFPFARAALKKPCSHIWLEIWQFYIYDGSFHSNVQLDFTVNLLRRLNQ